jgi:hypothetical protein
MSTSQRQSHGTPFRMSYWIARVSRSETVDTIAGSRFSDLTVSFLTLPQHGLLERSLRMDNMSLPSKLTPCGDGSDKTISSSS